MEFLGRDKCEYPEPDSRCEKVAVVILDFINLDTLEKKAVPVCGYCFLKARIDSEKRMIREVIGEGKINA